MINLKQGHTQYNDGSNNINHNSKSTLQSFDCAKTIDT